MLKVQGVIGTLLLCIALAACGGGSSVGSGGRQPKNEQQTIREVYEIFERRAEINGHDPVEYAPPECEVMAPELAYDCIQNRKRNGRRIDDGR
jgi:hypothetical protein